MEDIQVNLTYCWFSGYDLDEAIPDHNLLPKANVCLGLRAFERLFQLQQMVYDMNR